jgi:hypothetical protein
MSETLIHDAGGFVTGDARGKVATKGEASATSAARPEAPVGYRWVSRRWRVLPDGTRDYAAFHGKTEFTFLLPVSSKLRRPKR